jgi:hypothetical protein
MVVEALHGLFEIGCNKDKNSKEALNHSIVVQRYLVLSRTAASYTKNNLSNSNSKRGALRFRWLRSTPDSVRYYLDGYSLLVDRSTAKSKGDFRKRPGK